MIIIEKEYLWIMLIEEIDYILYKKLMNIFESVSNLYKESKDKEKFKKIICSENILIKNSIYKKIISDELKEKSEKIYFNLKSQNIKFISIDSIYYPKDLKNIGNPPVLLFYFGDLLFNNSKKIIYIYNDSLSKFGAKVYKYFSYHINNNMLKIGISEDVDIKVVNENIFDFNYENKNINDRIIIPYNNINVIYNIIFSLSDYLLLIEAKYNKETKNIIESFIDLGKELLVVPGNIFNKNNYFSNYLIQEGATVLLNKNDLIKYL